ncbi:MAG: hypothetical protein HY719_06545, partial [Planctomycetes bacterium]|nr:hypothetical protein [Planctomycetota bacterium]
MSQNAGDSVARLFDHRFYPRQAVRETAALFSQEGMPVTVEETADGASRVQVRLEGDMTPADAETVLWQFGDHALVRARKFRGPAALNRANAPQPPTPD